MLKTEDASMVADEFPRYPIHALPGDIPDWLICCAWNNDTCPIWCDARRAEGWEGLSLAIDYPRADDREIDGAQHFSVWWTAENGEQIGDAFSSDDWEAVKVELARRRGTAPRRCYRLADTVRHNGCDYRNVTAAVDFAAQSIVLTAELDGAALTIPLDAEAVKRLYMVIDRLDDTNDEAEAFRL